MQWIGGLTETARRAARTKECMVYQDELRQWCKWFAWCPVVVDITADGHKIWKWFENVERRATAFDEKYPCVVKTWGYRNKK